MQSICTQIILFVFDRCFIFGFTYAFLPIYVRQSSDKTTNTLILLPSLFLSINRPSIIYLPTLPICIFIYLLIYISIYPYIHKYISIYIYLFIYLFIHSFIHLFIPIYLSLLIYFINPFT